MDKLVYHTSTLLYPTRAVLYYIQDSVRNVSWVVVIGCDDYLQISRAVFQLIDAILVQSQYLVEAVNEFCSGGTTSESTRRL